MSKKIAVEVQKVAKSIETPGGPRSNPSGLPYGTGSLQIRGTSWWAIYRDAEGRTIQENMRTKDRNTALRMLLQKSLATAQAKVEALEKLLDEAEEATSPTEGQEPDDHRAERGSGSRPVSQNSEVREKCAGKKGGSR